MIGFVRHFVFLAIVALALSVSTPQSQAVDIDLLDTIIPATSTGDNVIAVGERNAQSFMTTASGSTISQVDLSIKKAPGAAGQYSVSIYSMNSVSSEPDARLSYVAQNQSQSALGTAYGTVSFTGLSIALDPSKNYYIVLEDVTLAAMDWQYWDTTSSGISPSTYWMGYSSGSWISTPSTDYPAMMKVMATTVPEPAAWAMSALAIAALGTRLRRWS